MTIFALKGSLEEITPAQLSEQTCSAVFITDSAHAEETLRTANITYEGVISLRDVVFCKIESQPFCLAGTLSIPKLLDIKGSRHRIQFFIDNKNMVIIDDEEFSLRLVQRIQRSRHNQGESREHFIYNFFSEFMLRDTELLAEHEQKLMELEENVNDGKTDDFLETITPIRKELLILRSYYDEIMDLGRELEEDENGFFEKKQKKYFGTISDRADRLMGRTVHLLEYATQVRDAYQSHVNAQQNKNMEFLTVISTIFFPLTLITGWYGMNFQNMPELKEGYPGVIALSVIVVIVCIIFFNFFVLKVRNGGKFIFHLLNLDNNCAIITLYLRKEVTCLNKELLLLLLKLAAGCVVIMTFIVIACLITPKIARFIEKRHPELAEKDDPERVDGENTGNDPENYKVQGIFDKSHIDGWDPNYKIYNEDIYALNFKKKKKNVSSEAVKKDDGNKNNDNA